MVHCTFVCTRTFSNVAQCDDVLAYVARGIIPGIA